MKMEDHLADIEMFSELSRKDLKSVGRLMTSVQIKTGKALMKEGEPGREFLIIIDGTATVRRGGRVLAQVGPGDFLGELAIIAGVPRNATVTADAEMEVSVLNRREFTTLLDDQPSIARKVLVGAVKRIHNIEPGLTS